MVHRASRYIFASAACIFLTLPFIQI
uniref:Uncharacterized protein n=1 Tax=Anguilla anguilla TaxID=7936 RepID=A0A0E9SIU1_ANGAN